MIRALVAFDPSAEEVVVDGKTAHHLVRVLRLEVGARVELFDGEGRARDAVVTELGAELVKLCAGPVRDLPREQPLTLALGLTKGEKFELVLQKGTELGATAFQPLALERSVVRLDPAKVPERLARWRTIVEQAARQCGRADVPELRPPATLDELLAASSARGARLLVLDEEERAVRLGAAIGGAGAVELVLLVGPEGGLTRAEVSRAVAAGASPVTLGRLVLRAETAPLAALAVVKFLRGELG